MPKVAILDSGAVDLEDLNVDQVPVGSLLRTTDGDYYRLANSDAEIPSEPIAADDDAVATAIAATATGGFTLLAQPDVPRVVSVSMTTPGGEGVLPWDGGTITFRGLDEDGGVLEESLTPDPNKIVYGSELFASLSGAPFKQLVGYSSRTVKCGYGPAVTTPTAVAVLGQGSMRWLYANDEVLPTALARLWTWDTSRDGNVGRPVQGQCSTLQDVVEANNFLLRALVEALQEAGIATGDVLDGFFTTSER